MFTVYRLVDPIEPEHYRFVGKTKHYLYTGRPVKLERLLKAHIRQALNERAKTNYKINWLRKLLFAEPFRCPIIEVIKNFEIEERAFEIEKHCITKYRAEGHKLINEGISDKTRVKIGIARVKMNAARKTNIEADKADVETDLKTSIAEMKAQLEALKNN